MENLLGLIIIIILFYVGFNFVKRKNFNRRLKKAVNELSSGNNASFIPLDPIENNYRPVGKEKILQIHSNLSRMEYKSTGRYSYGGASVSIPIVKGVRFRVGSGNIASQKSFQSTDIGRLLVTNKALVFEGGNRNDRWTWAQISDVEFCTDGLAIHRRSGKPILLQTSKPDTNVFAVIDLWLRRIE